MARDLNLSMNDFKTVVTNSAGKEQLLDGMMVAFHLDSGRLQKGGAKCTPRGSD